MAYFIYMDDKMYNFNKEMVERKKKKIVLLQVYSYIIGTVTLRRWIPELRNLRVGRFYVVAL